MPVDLPSEQLEEALSTKTPFWWLRHSRFDGGVGIRYRKEHRTSLKERYGYWFGDWDTWDDPAHLPVLATVSTTPTGISPLETDYASMIEVALGGVWYVVLVKGTKSYATTDDAFGAATDTVTSAQGRQMVYGYVTGTNYYILVWFCGSGATARYTTNPTGTWTAIGSTPITMVCGWFAYAGSTDQQTLFAIRVGGGALANHIYGITTLSGAWSDTGIAVPPAISSGIGVIPLGSLTDNGTVFLANGPRIWEVTHSSRSSVAVPHVHWTGLAEITYGCRLRDRFAITDGSTILLWHPTQPSIDISIWSADGVPSDRTGRVRSLVSLGDILIAYYELDAGGTSIYWGRFNGQGDFCWHQRMKAQTGEFPLSVGSPMVMAHQTYSTSQRFWMITADTSVSRAVRQDFP